ncbi:MAG: Re/Si-specific NAD(P)(+) transhydrogenase subunit alpha [Gammaproteobacteria bacterium]|nr:Re/Si-specific NAD(P)(+) transhydrogenase subunit alpha [Gammaproteobacteria bacterium]
MRIAVPRETWPGELRAALVPSSVKKLVGLGFDVMVETGLGAASGFPDRDYEAAGADVVKDIASALVSSEVVLRVRRPAEADLEFLAEDTLHISFLDPFNEKPLIGKLAARGVTAVSMEMIPRTTRAQKMDALSSQASLAGYVTVVLAASHTPKVFPMMMTPAGTIAPARVFVIGAGVAGLQAVATAKRLGARVEAFDTRPAVAEQVQSLGARFVEIDIGEIGQTEQGYARELTAEQIEMQRQGMKRVIGYSDVVITTAQVFGRPAPRIVTRDMVEAMRPGSVVVDMAVESGGNVEGSVLDEVVDIDGVKLVGLGNLPSEVAQNASEMYSSNVTHFIDEFYDAENGRFDLDPADEIVAGCVLTRGGEVVSETARAA